MRRSLDSQATEANVAREIARIRNALLRRAKDSTDPALANARRPASVDARARRSHCRGVAQDPDSQIATPVDVELDIFSGRANPHWRLSNDEARRLHALQADLRVTAQSRPELPGLGYRGFRYLLDGVSWRAFGGLVDSGTQCFVSSGREIERFLACHLPPEAANLRAVIARDLPDGLAPIS